MCGRFGFTKDRDSVKKRFNLKKVPDELPVLYNIAPHQNVPAILNESKEQLSMVRWGLIPHWSQTEDFKLNLINAKAETIAEKPIFKGLVKSKRCLILADFFYEWQKANGDKLPYRILLKDEGLFGFAGIWDRWEKEGIIITSCCIITTSANELVKDIHDRMPVILPKEKEEAWIGQLNPKDLSDILKPYNPKEMTAHRVSKAINSPANNSAELIQVYHG